MQHDDTIVALLSSMHVWNGMAPPYASAVIVEMLKVEGSRDPIVQLLYRNDSSGTLYPLRIPG